MSHNLVGGGTFLCLAMMAVLGTGRGTASPGASFVEAMVQDRSLSPAGKKHEGGREKYVLVSACTLDSTIVLHICP